MARPKWLIKFVSIVAREGVRYHIPTTEGQHSVENGTLVALVHPDVTEADQKRLNDLLNSGAFIAAFVPKEGS